MTLPRVGAALVLLLASGCKKDEKPADLFATVSGSATGVYVGDAVGVGSATVPVFHTNTFGAAVPGDAVELQSTGALDATSTTPDATGWAEATVTDGVGSWEVTGVTGAAQAAGRAAVTGAAPGVTGFPGYGAAGIPSFVVGAGNGVVHASGSRIWWTALDGSSTARVANLPSEVLGLEAVQGEGDGVADVLAWTSDAVILLRGRSGGGLTWGGGWETGDGAVAGAVARDLDGDATMDLALLTVDGDTSTVSVYDGDGSWGFTLVDQLEVPYAAWSVSAEDLDLDGSRELTLLTADSLVRRYARFDEGWSTSGSYEYDVAFLEGGRLVPGVDVTADGIEDILAYGPDREGDGWQAWIIDAGASATVYRMLNPDAEGALPGHAALTTGELSGDGVGDVLLLTDTTLYAGFWNVVTDAFTLFAYPDVPAGGAVAAADLTGDGVGDALVGGSQLTVLRGSRVDDDPETEEDESVDWKVETPSAKVTDFYLAVPPVLRDFDGDGIVDLASAADTAGGLQIQVYGGAPADADSAEGFRSRGAAVLSTTGAAEDIVVCEDDLWVSVVEDTGTWLHHYRFNSGGAPVVAEAPVAVPGGQIACGPFPAGDVAVADDGGDVGYVTGTSVTPASGSPAYDAAALDVAGTRTLVVCETPGCTIVAGDFDGDGVEEHATADGTTLTLVTATGSWAVYAPGALSAADADGDGLLDLVVTDAAEVRVYRVLDAVLTAASATYVWRPSLGPAGWGDLDGDALPDLLLTGWDSDPDDATDWTGTLIYARALPTE